jgi:hypothetical protein
MAQIRTDRGEVLREEFMKPLGLSAQRARAGVARTGDPYWRHLAPEIRAR